MGARISVLRDRFEVRLQVNASPAVLAQGQVFSLYRSGAWAKTILLSTGEPRDC